MYENFIEQTKVNPLEFKNPPKYLEGIRGFSSAFLNLKTPDKELKRLIVILNNLLDKTFWDNFEIEQKIEELEEKFNSLKSIEKMFQTLQKIDELKANARSIKIKAATISNYIDLFQERAKREFDIVERRPKRRRLFISNSELAHGEKPRDILHASKEVVFHRPPTLNQSALEEVKKVLPDVMRGKMLPDGRKGLEKDSYRKRLIMWLRIDDGNKVNITKDQLKDIEAKAYNSEFARLREEFLNKNKIISWSKIPKEEKAYLFKKFQKQAEAYSKKVAKAKAAGIIEAPVRDENGFTAISINFTDGRADDLIEDLETKFEQLKINYGLNQAAIRLDKISYVEKRLALKSETSSKDWIDEETGEILENEEQELDLSFEKRKTIKKKKRKKR